MGLDLKMKVRESGKPAGPEDAAPAPDRTYVMQVRLGREWIRYRKSAGTEIILDLARRRRIELDENARTYVENSLYATVDFRHIELPNREMIRSVIAAGEGDASGFEPIMAEHHLAMLDPKGGRTLAKAPRSKGLRGFLKAAFGGATRSDISVESEEGHTVYATADGHRLLSYSGEGTDVEPDMGRQFVQYLRYRYMGHPLILERLASESRVPRELRYSALMPVGFSGSRVTLEVESVDVVPDAALSLDGHRRLLDSAETGSFVEALERVLLGAVPDRQEVTARRMEEAKQALQSGRRLEGVLTLLELTLETEETLPELGSILQSEPDAAVQRLKGALTRSPASEADVREVLATYRELREAAGPRAHVLKTFEAASHHTLGEVEEARGLLFEAIEANPFLAGAYKDLGDLYLRSFQMTDAWMCWEAARKISPGHRLVKDVNEREAMLAATYPEYF